MPCFRSKHTSGIIPARAGFTPDRATKAAKTRDHPRSRGVYRPLSGQGPPVSGSSPLARGLPGPRTRRTRRRGIIPARAGFTPTIIREEHRLTDHPRSRGVYTAHFLDGITAAGSSPLARGLRPLRHRIRRRRRIIPARAGFTVTSWSITAWSADHPRSRGVYVWKLAIGCTFQGSSPLARGLPP